MLVASLGGAGCASSDADSEDYLAWGGGKEDGVETASPAALERAFPEGDSCGCANATSLLPPFGPIEDTSWKRLETDHFSVLYRTDGPDRVVASWLDLIPKDGHPDFINEVAKGAEAGYSRFIGGLGYADPGKTTIYVKDAKEFFGYENAGTVVIDNDSFAFRISRHFLRATVAHEYFHVLQEKLAGGTWTDQDRWLTESAAVWAEQEATGLWGGFVGAFVRDAVVAGRLKQGVHESLLSNEPVFAANLGYSTFLWEQFLVERLGDPGVVKRSFELMHGGRSALSAVDDMLKERGTSIEAEFREWTTWNYLVGNRDDGAHYSDGHDIFHGLTSSHVEATYKTPPADFQTTKTLPALLGANYIEFAVSSSAVTFTIDVEGEGNRLVGLSTLGKRRSDGAWITVHHPASTTAQSVQVDHAGQFDKIVLVVQHLIARDPSVSQRPMSYRYRATQL